MRGAFADVIINQIYENEAENPLEIVFMIPKDDNLTVTSLQVDFVLQDGSSRSIVSKIMEKAAA